MILHTVALGFAVGELALTAVARRGRPRSGAAVVASLAMVAAMADGLIAPRVVPTVVWAAILIALALGIALLARRGAASGARAASPRGGPEAALGLIAMAFLPFVGAGHPVGATGGHGHGPEGSGLTVLLVALLLAVTAAALWSWRHRPGPREAVAARACMLCSLTTMMAAVLR